MMNQLKLQRLIREPLVHFLLIGAGLFILFDQIGEPVIEADRRIVITQANLDFLATSWLRSRGRPATALEREKQLQHYIREQVLSREAMAMGLDKNDAIVRRRLAKKMEYLFNDLTIIPEPTETELSNFLSEHSSKFTRPADITFTQIFFDPDLRGKKAGEDTEKLLKQLKETTAEIDTINMGDQTLLPYNLTKTRKNEITSTFGEKFSNQAFKLPVASWQGPVISEYGIHLVYINSRTEARLPPLAEIRQRVANEWRTMKEQANNKIFYQSLLQRYEIILDQDVSTNTMVSTE
jgi:hypothetical protein